MSHFPPGAPWPLLPPRGFSACSSQSRKLFIGLLTRPAPSHPSRFSLYLIPHWGSFLNPLSTSPFPKEYPVFVELLKRSWCQAWCQGWSLFDLSQSAHSTPLLVVIGSGVNTWPMLPNQMTHIGMCAYLSARLHLPCPPPGTAMCGHETKMITATSPPFWEGSWHKELESSWSPGVKPILRPALPLDLSYVNHFLTL